MRRSGIYKIEHVASGRVYVGSAVQCNLRWNNHRHDLRLNKHGNRHLQRAWNKYGQDAFSFSTLERVADKSLLLQREQFWIDKLRAANEPNFNLCPVAGNCLGVTRGPEVRERGRLSALRNNLIAYTRTPEAVANFRDAMRSPEVRAKISAAAKARPPMSAETRAKMSALRTGVPQSPAHRAKRSSALKGIPLSQETRAKLSLVARSNATLTAARVAQLNSPQAIAKRVATIRLRKALTAAQ